RRPRPPLASRLCRRLGPGHRSGLPYARDRRLTRRHRRSLAAHLSSDTPAAAAPRPAEVALLTSVFVVAACGLVYELAAGALASYLLGDSVLQFSTVIGTYLFAMGVGSWLSRHVERELVAQFLRIELAVGLIGGLMPAALFVAHSVLPASGGASFRDVRDLLVLVVDE